MPEKMICGECGGEMNQHAEKFVLNVHRDFADLTRVVMEIADRHAGGRVVSMLEGMGKWTLPPEKAGSGKLATPCERMQAAALR